MASSIVDSGASRAGAAYMRMLQDDPQEAAKWEMRKRIGKVVATAMANTPEFKALGACMQGLKRAPLIAKSPEFKALSAALEAAEQQRSQELAKIAHEVRAAWQRATDHERSELAKRHIDFDPSSLDLDNWLYLAHLVKIPTAEIDGLTYGGIFIRALAYVDNIKLKLKLKEERRAARKNNSQQSQIGQPKKTAKRGPKKADYETVQREATLAADWVRARENRIPKVDFARERSLRVKDLDALLDRVATRKRKNASE